jgi:hypothetical protein
MRKRTDLSQMTPEQRAAHKKALHKARQQRYLTNHPKAYAKMKERAKAHLNAMRADPEGRAKLNAKDRERYARKKAAMREHFSQLVAILG